MKKTTTLEEMIFDGRDGSGMTFRVLEKGAGWDPEATYHKLEIDADVTLGFPLGTPQMTRMMGEALIRTADRMDAQPRAGGRYPLFRNVDVVGSVRMRGGLRMRPVYEHTCVTSRYSVGRRLLGIDWLDAEDFVVRYEPIQSDRHPSGSGGSEAQFTEDEVGMMLSEVTKKRAAAGLPDHLYASRNHEEITTIQTRYVVPGACAGDLRFIGVGRKNDPLPLEDPEGDLALIHRVADNIEPGNNNLIHTTIRTFYALPFLRRDQEARRTFAERLASNLGWTLADTKALISRIRAD